MKILVTAVIVLSLGVWAQAENSIDKVAVRQVIKENVALFQKCYSDELKKAPKIQGKVILSWDILDTGEVKTVSIKSSSLKNKVVENCMMALVKKLNFPMAPQGTIANISYPFVFGRTQ